MKTHGHNLKFFCRKTIASVIQKNVPKNTRTPQELEPSVEGNKENKQPTEVAKGDVAAHEITISETEEISNWLSLEEEILCDTDLTGFYFRNKRQRIWEKLRKFVVL